MQVFESSHSQSGDPEIEILQVRREVISFHGSEEIKRKYLTRVRRRRLTGRLVQGLGEKKGKGGAIWCTLLSSNCWSYEDDLGIPNQLAFLEDELFEALSSDQAMLFPEQFLEAIPVGVDLYPAFWRFALFTLLDEANGLMAYYEDKQAVFRVADFYRKALAGQEIPLNEYLSVRKAAGPANGRELRVLDALDPLDPQAFVSAGYILNSLAFMDRRAAIDLYGCSDSDVDYREFETVRANVWRNKLLEYLSSPARPDR